MLVLTIRFSDPQVRYCSSGTEATLFALRAGRAHSGKPMVLKFEGGAFEPQLSTAVIKPRELWWFLSISRYTDTVHHCTAPWPPPDYIALPACAPLPSPPRMYSIPWDE
eukprot:SAG11_NODE_2521_length_3261_cov_1.530993_7_plen_109_part_00